MADQEQRNVFWENRSLFSDYFLSERLDQFENSSNFPGGKTRTTHEKLMESDVPIFDKKANIDPLIELREELAETEEKIEKTDWLIDQVVYRLYGLSKEEVKVVEESV